MGIPRAVAQKIDMVQTGEMLLPELVPHGKRRGSPAGGRQVPHGGQEVAVAEDLGAPCLAAFTHCRFCHHRLTCEYMECPVHVNKPSYK